VAGPVFLIARNPEEDSKLPYLLHLPIEDGLVLKALDTWPRSARIKQKGRTWEARPFSSFSSVFSF
jgi:hypothetical protein